MEKNLTLPKGELLTVEALRGFAAISIVFFHAAINTAEYFPRYQVTLVNYDRHGWNEILAATAIDLFFVVSGFVLFLLAKKTTQSPLKFLYLRASRLAGLYWLLTIIFILAFTFFSHHSYTAKQITESLLFLPTKNMEGAPYPIIFVAWTLTYEMLFYLLLTIGMIFKKRIPIFLTTAFLLITLHLAAQAAPESWFTLNRLGQQQVLSFIVGMTLAVILTKYKIGKKLGALLLATGAILWVQMAFEVEHRLVDGALPAALVLAGSLAFENNLRQSILGKVVKFIGNSTYSIYLIQVFSIPLAYHLLGKSQILQHSPFLITLVLVTLISLVCGVITYYVIERRINDYRHRLIKWKNPN